jgi:hypothetical protein
MICPSVRPVLAGVVRVYQHYELQSKQAIETTIYALVQRPSWQKERG